METTDWKDALAQALGYEPEEEQAATPQPRPGLLEQQGKQTLDVLLDRRNRHGKKVTLVTGFVCSDDALLALAAELKRLCGVGGSARGGEILIQGDQRAKILSALKAKGLKARII